jgi:NADPH-dependent glutamate synthase beta subunit-like oxidoreductase
MDKSKEQKYMEEIPLFISRSSTTTEINKTGSWRFARPKYDEKIAPCSAACPAGEDISRIEMLTNQGLFEDAIETILIENPFPAVCGRVCFHPCETACNRADFDESIAIHCIERFLGDFAIWKATKLSLSKLSDNGKRVCIVGAGPAGLAGSYFLTLLGYSCDVFEATTAPGGILRWGIPKYRLPETVLKNEIERIKNLGVKIHCKTPVTQSFLEEVKNRYNAFFIGCGYGRSLRMNIDGEKMVFDGLEFLKKMRREEITPFTNTAAVIGGGNTAVDVARSLVRMGAKTILVYRRRQQDMPAFKHEVEMAVEDGVEIMELFSPIRIEKTGKACFLTLQQMKVSKTEPSGSRARVEPDGRVTQLLRVQRIYTAIGAEVLEHWHSPPKQNAETLNLSHCTISGKELPWVFGGDLTNPVKSVTDAIASGKQAAMALDTFFKKGWDAISERLDSCRVANSHALSMESYMGKERAIRNLHIVSYDEINTDYFSPASRVGTVSLSVDKRIKSFSETEETYTSDQAMEETRRCFNCGTCNECDNCRIFCPEVAVVFKDSRREINLDYCKGCGICVVECPRNAMALEEEV